MCREYAERPATVEVMCRLDIDGAADPNNGELLVDHPDVLRIEVNCMTSSGKVVVVYLAA